MGREMCSLTWWISMLDKSFTNPRYYIICFVALLRDHSLGIKFACLVYNSELFNIFTVIKPYPLAYFRTYLPSQKKSHVISRHSSLIPTTTITLSHWKPLICFLPLDLLNMEFVCKLTHTICYLLLFLPFTKCVSIHPVLCILASFIAMVKSSILSTLCLSSY